MPADPTLSLSQLRSKAVVSVEEAGLVLGISRNSAYLAARTGDLPTIRIGRRLLVPTHALLRMLGVDTEAS